MITPTDFRNAFIRTLAFPIELTHEDPPLPPSVPGLPTKERKQVELCATPLVVTADLSPIAPNI
jgi:hypothetical protein